MKKNFFKKLSFVMALAMIVTALAPAAGVFAAAAPKLNAKKVYIHVAEKTTEFDFNIANKKTGWKYSWKSSNEDVAEVASNGLVTAVGKGTATISVVIKNAKGEKVDTLKGTVVVRDNIKKLTITNAKDQLAVGASNDFNRSFVTASGNKKVTSGITRWEVDKAGATIVANSGLFTATEAGTYTITARAFQSTAKYNSWLSDKTKYASYVTATATTTVKVAPTMLKAEQVDLDTVKVTFDSPVADADTKLTVAQVVSGTDVITGIKSVSLSADKKVATIDMNNNFAEEFVYKVQYPEMTAVQFTAAKVDAALVTSIAVTTTTAQEGRPTEVKVALYNKDMVNISNDTLKTRVTLETSGTNASVSGRDIYLYTKGSTATVKATYHTFTYDTAGQETGTLTASGVITCVEYADYQLDSIAAYSIKDSNVNAPDWVTVNHKVAVDDTGRYLWIKFAGKEWDGDSIDWNNKDGRISGAIKFESSNNNILLIDSTSGYVTPVNPGTASVIVKYNDTVVGAVAVTVVAKRAVSSVQLSTNTLTLSNKFSDPTDVTLTVKDQFGDKMDPTSKYTVELGTPSGVSMHSWTAGTSTSNQGKITIDADRVTAGTYSYSVKVKDSGNNTVVTSMLNVVVQTTDATQPTSFKVEVGKSSYDLNISSDDNTEDATFAVYGYANGVKVRKETLTTNTSASFYVAFEKDGGEKTSDGTKFSIDPVTNKVATFKLVDTAAKSGSAVAVTKEAVGTYTIKYFDKVNNRVLAQNTFSVTDTQVKPTWKLAKTLVDITDPTNMVEAAREAFDVSLDGKNIDSDIFAVDYEASSNNNYAIKKLHVKKDLGAGGAYLEFVLDVNVSITTK